MNTEINTKVSVIIPVYNVEKYLRECLDSVINQTLKEIEIICVDDGSTDSSLEILREYERKEPRLTVLTQQNKFAGVARNAGLAIARGEYCAFLDSDDFFEANALKALYTTATKNNLDMIKCSFCYYENDTGKTYQTKYSQNGAADGDLRGRVISFADAPEKLIYVGDVPWNGLYRRQFILDNGIEFNSLRCVNDHSFFVHCLIKAKRFMVVDTIIAYYRTGLADSLIGKKINHYNCQLESYRIVSELCRDLSDNHKHAVLERELDAVFGWYQQICDRGAHTEELDAMLQGFVDNFDTRDMSRGFMYRFKYGHIYTSFRRRSPSAPLISIILPAYNVEQYIGECMDSLVNQTLDNIEIICVDDASSDDTVAMLRKYEEADKRVTVIASEVNRHQGGARNIGLSLATGRYNWFIDSDDFIDLDAAEILYNKMQELGDVDVLCFDADAFVDNAEGERVDCPERAIKHAWPKERVIKIPEDLSQIPEQVDGSSVVYITRREFIDGFRYRENVFFEDADFSFDIFTSHAKFYFIEGYTPYHRRVTETSTTGKVNSTEERAETTRSRIIAAGAIMEIIKKKALPLEHPLVQWFVVWARYVITLYLPRQSIYTKEVNTIVQKIENTYKLLHGDVKKRFPKVFGAQQNPVRDGDYRELYELYKTELELTRKSASYKIGRFITWGPRMIRGFFRCLRENGFKYTVKRVFYHITPGPIYRFCGKLYRKIKGFFACLREHGLKYTCNRVLVALHLKKDPYAIVAEPAINNAPVIPSDKVPLGCSKTPHTPELVVSLTSFPARIGTVHKTIETILRQTERPDKVILWLAEEQFPGKEKDLPRELTRLTHHGLTIAWCSDIRSYKKLIPTLKLYPDAVIVTADDDAYYHSDWLKTLYESYLKHPNFIHCHRITKFYRENEEWRWVPAGLASYPCPAYLHKLVGLGGVLYPPHSLHHDVLNEELFRALAKTNDDIWFWFMAIRNNYKILFVKGAVPDPKLVEGSQEEALFKENDRGAQLFLQDFNRLLERFPEVKERLLSEIEFLANYEEALALPRSAKNYELLSSLPTSKYEAYLAEWFYFKTGLWLNLDNPLTYNEKIQWLKLYDATEIKTRLVDKYLVRDWVKDMIGEEHLVPLLGVWDNFDDIDFDSLPNRFVLKTNHGSGSVYIVKDKSKLDIEDARRKFAGWMSKNFAFGFGFEMQYLNVVPKIIAEEYLEELDQVYDYKFVCFNGECKFIWVDTDRFTGHKRTLFTTDWQVMDEYIVHPKSDRALPRPKCLDEMLEYAEKMSREFAHARVDFYEVNGHVYFGEMTFTSSSGTENPTPASFGIQMGNWLTLPEKSPLPERKF